MIFIYIYLIIHCYNQWFLKNEKKISKATLLKTAPYLGFELDINSIADH